MVAVMPARARAAVPVVATIRPVGFLLVGRVPREVPSSGLVWVMRIASFGGRPPCAV